MAAEEIYGQDEEYLKSSLIDLNKDLRVYLREVEEEREKRRRNITRALEEAYKSLPSVDAPEFLEVTLTPREERLLRIPERFLSDAERDEVKAIRRKLEPPEDRIIDPAYENNPNYFRLVIGNIPEYFYTKYNKAKDNETYGHVDVLLGQDYYPLNEEETEEFYGKSYLSEIGDPDHFRYPTIDRINRNIGIVSNRLRDEYNYTTEMLQSITQ